LVETVDDERRHLYMMIIQSNTSATYMLRRILRVAALGIAVFASGCGKSKAEECSAIIEKYNAVGEAMRKGFGDGTDPAAIEANAKEVEAASTSFSNVSVKTEKVKAVQTNLAKVFADYARLMKSMAGALRDVKDPAKTDAANARLTEASTAAEAIKTELTEKKQALLTECGATAK
jgi:hypothetical protein